MLLLQHVRSPSAGCRAVADLHLGAVEAQGGHAVSERVAVVAQLQLDLRVHANGWTLRLSMKEGILREGGDSP